MDAAHSLPLMLCAKVDLVFSSAACMEGFMAKVDLVFSRLGRGVPIQKGKFVIGIYVVHNCPGLVAGFLGAGMGARTRADWAIPGCSY